MRAPSNQREQTLSNRASGPRRVLGFRTMDGYLVPASMVTSESVPSSSDLLGVLSTSPNCTTILRMQSPNVKEQLEGLGAVIAADRGTPEYLARLAQLAR
jgi:hypothetical protein